MTDADTVHIKLKPPGSAAVIALTATIVNAAAGEIYADANSSQIATVGDWAAWGVATWLDGRVVKTYGTKFRVVEEGTSVYLGDC
jgi:hypothetical protein